MPVAESLSPGTGAREGAGRGVREKAAGKAVRRKGGRRKAVRGRVSTGRGAWCGGDAHGVSPFREVKDREIKGRAIEKPPCGGVFSFFYLKFRIPNRENKHANYVGASVSGSGLE